MFFMRTAYILLKKLRCMYLCLYYYNQFKVKVVTWMVSLIGQHLSMMKPWTNYHTWNVIRSLMSSQPSLSETNKTCHLDPGSDAIPAEIYKAEGPPVAEKLSYFTLCGEKKPSLKIQGCNNHPLIQRERESSSLRHSSGHLFTVKCWEDHCKSPTELIERTPWTVRASTRKQMWIQERQRNDWYVLPGKTASREMLGTECGPLHDLCRPYQIILHQSWGTFENYGSLAALPKSWQRCGSFTIVIYLQGSKMMVSFLIHSLLQMELSKAVY